MSFQSVLNAWGGNVDVFEIGREGKKTVVIRPRAGASLEFCPASARELAAVLNRMADSIDAEAQRHGEGEP